MGDRNMPPPTFYFLKANYFLGLVFPDDRLEVLVPELRVDDLVELDLVELVLDDPTLLDELRDEEGL